jgi:hypothetical protein
MARGYRFDLTPNAPSDELDGLCASETLVDALADHISLELRDHAAHMDIALPAGVAVSIACLS